MQAQFSNLNMGSFSNFSRFKAVENSINNPIKVEIFEPFQSRLHADPMVVVEHIRFFAILVNQFDTFFAKVHHEVMDKLHPVAVFV